ncbi:MAG TPA: sigma-70 family RNA polymerase sigma factor [Anaerohalosphaeraceae bacterium]|nr:sigma-70 family RNA polymerase sigma factor [Anaerohalosphaeraceae bacterium]
MDRAYKDLGEEFVFLMSTNQRKIYSYILAAVGRQSIADEIMQQTSLTMWRNFARFQRGTNFTAWGKEIAKYEIFTYRKKNSKEQFLDPESLRRVLEASQKVEKSSDQRMKALEGCLEKLTEKKRSLLQYRYQEGLSCSAVADKMQLPLATVYRTMARIHKVLQDCIHRTLILWETES